MSCGFAGNTDIFGIGIRIGYYTQALAVWFSNYFLFQEARGLRAANNIFLLALCIAATIYFSKAPTTHAIEAFLMLQIGLVIGLVGITERSRYSSKYVNNSSERMIMRMVIIMAGGFFNVCFWWRELNIMLPTPCGEQTHQHEHRANTYIFYVVKANAYGWAATLMKIQSLAAIVWTAPRIITFDTIVLLYNFRLRQIRAAFIKAVEVSKSVHRLDGRTTVIQNKTRPPPFKAEVTAPTLNAEAPYNAITDSMDLIKNVNKAIRYMDTLFSIYPKDKKGVWTKRNVHFCSGLVRIQLPCYESACTERTASYGQCLMLFLKSEFTNNPSFDRRWMLALHMTASGQHSSFRWPRILHRMYTLGQTSEPPDWRHIAIASDILLTQIPVVITRRTWMLMAAWQLFFIVILILQVELTIAWNHVSGLQKFSSLGQLIPFILGVGGLLKVLWGKWKMISEGLKEERYAPNGEYEEAMAKFLERREGCEKRTVVRAVTT